MKTHTIKTYNISELSSDAFRKAIDQNRDQNLQFEWYESIYEEWKEKLATLGFTVAEINFTGFYSQGDGASFESQVDLIKWISTRPKYAVLEELINDSEITALVRRKDFHYNHKNTCTAEVSSNYTPHDETSLKLVDELETELEAERLKLCEELYKDLENEHDALTEEDSICCSLEAEGVQFLIDGERAPYDLQ